MTFKIAPHHRTRPSARTAATPVAGLLAGLAITLAAGIGVSAPASATELKAPSVKSRLLRDKDDITIIIIDRDDKRSTSKVRTPGQSKSTPLRQPSSRIIRDDDEVTVRIKRDDTAGGTIVKSGAKVIIVDKDTNGCDGAGVCVIRP